jgi:hypothetical protein
MNSKTETETRLCGGSSRKPCFVMGAHGNLACWKPGSVMEAHCNTAMMWELRIPCSVVGAHWRKPESIVGVIENRLCCGSSWRPTQLWELMERQLWFRSSRKPSLLGAHGNPAWCEISNILYNSGNLIFQCYRKLWVLQFFCHFLK